MPHVLIPAGTPAGMETSSGTDARAAPSDPADGGAAPNAMIEIPLGKIRLGMTEARQRRGRVDPDDDLVHSIRRHGLLRPITVRRTDGGSYEIIAGQRRFMVHEILGESTIRALVLETGYYGEKAVSLSDNVCQMGLEDADCVDSIRIFMERCVGVGAVAEEMGLSRATVRRHLKSDVLPEHVRERLRDERIGERDADRALEMLGAGDNADPDYLVAARHMRGLPTYVRKRYESIMRDEPGIGPGIAASRARKRQVDEQITVDVTEEQMYRIGEFMDRNGMRRAGDVASELIGTGLGTR